MTLAPLVLHTTITLGYDVPWRLVHEVLIDAARGTEHILEKPEPFVLQTSLDDFYVSYELNACTETPKLMPRIYSHLHQNIQDKCNEAGIEILSPHYRGCSGWQSASGTLRILAQRLPDAAFRVEQTLGSLNGQPVEEPKTAQDAELHQE